jgi:hypothetical protein
MLDPSEQKSRTVWKEFGQGLKLIFVLCLRREFREIASRKDLSTR